MLEEKTIKKWIKDNNKYIGFNQFYWAPNKTFKECYFYHYKNRKLEKEVKRCDFVLLEKLVHGTGGKLRNSKEIFCEWNNPKKPKKVVQKPEKKKQLVVIFPDGSKYEIFSRLKPPKEQRAVEYNAVKKMEKLIKHSRFVANKIK